MNDALDVTKATSIQTEPRSVRREPPDQAPWTLKRHRRDVLLVQDELAHAVWYTNERLEQGAEQR